MRRTSEPSSTLRTPGPDLRFIDTLTRAATERPFLMDLLELARRRRADERADKAA
ncbi:MAG: hypothetical protein KC486_05350 [Myxococcales bacterium]|nr:hypothetical protein [Myxococcales bacterium]